MKRILSYHSLIIAIFVIVFSCTENSSVNQKSEEQNEKTISNFLVETGNNLIQSEDPEALLEMIEQDLKTKFTSANVKVNQSTRDLVELTIKLKENDVVNLKSMFDNDFGDAFLDSRLSIWYTDMKSGEELEISLLKEDENNHTLRYLIRTYL